MSKDTADGKTCGSLGCSNDAVGKVPHNGTLVWTCWECAPTDGVLMPEGDQ